MRAHELFERVINAFTPQEKETISPEVWDILQQSYSKIGGFGTAETPEELIHSSGLWKVVRRDGRITAVNIYRDQNGRKSIASGTDGTTQGKRDYLMIKNDDVKFKRAWAEVSGAPEAILRKTGAKPIPAKFAPLLTKQPILSYSDDGIHYTRMIAGHPHEKAMYGIIKLTPTLEKELTAFGIDVKDLPDTFQKD